MDTKTTAPTFDKKRVYKRMIVLCWCILIFWFFVKLLGGEGIEIAVNSQRFIDFMAFVDGSILLKLVIGGSFNIVSIMLYWMICLGEKYKRCIKKAIPLSSYLLVCSFLKIIIPTIGLLIDVVTLFIVPCLCLKAKIHNVFVSFLFMVAFQFLSVFVKNLPLNEYLSTNPLIASICMIDYLLMLFLLFSKRKEKNNWVTFQFYGSAKTASNFKLCVTNVWQSVPKSIRRLRKSMKRLPNLMRNKIDRELFVRKSLSYLAIFACIGVFAYFTESFANSVILFVCYISLRYLFPTTFHTTPLRCMMLSVTLFCIVLGNVLPLNTSLLSGVFCAFAFDWCLWRWQEHQDLLCRYDADFTKYGLSAEMAKFAHDWKVEGLRDKELMIKYEIASVNTLNSRKRRIKQAMHTK